MTVKEFLLAHPENNDLPLVLIDQAGIIRHCKSCLEYCSKSEQSPKYKRGCAQLDLNGDDTFVIIYCDFGV